MNTTHQGTAKIYQFPAGGRAALGTRRFGETKAADAGQLGIQEAACGDSWYHQAAIEEDGPERRR
jgi:hypothetical protein